MSKNFGDKNSLKHTKSGSSNSKLDFLKGGMDFLDQEILNGIEPEDVSEEDLVNPELIDFGDDFEEDTDDETVTVEEEIAEEVKEVKTGKVTIVSRKVSVKKPVNTVVTENVEKDVNTLAKKLVKDVSSSEVKNFLHVSKTQKEQMLSGDMPFLARDKASYEEKKEFLSKLDEITSSEEVSDANAAFVLKWLKNRK